MVEEQKLILSGVRYALKSAKGKQGFVTCRRTKGLSMDLDDYIEAVDEWMLEKFPLETLELLLKILRAIIPQYSHIDDSNGNIQNCVSSVQFRIEQVFNEYINTECRLKAVKMICKEATLKAYDEWDDDAYMLMDLLAENVGDEKERVLIEEGLATLAEKEHIYKTFRDNRQKLIRSKMIEKIDGPQAYERYLLDHQNNVELEERLVSFYMKQGLYDIAEKKVNGLISKYKDHHIYKKKFMIMLHEIYVETNQLELRRNLDMMLWNLAGFSYYEDYKLTYKDSEWKEHYQEVLRPKFQMKIEAFSSVLPSIFIVENDSELLLIYCQFHPDMMPHYSSKLIEDYKEQVNECLLKLYTHEMDYANNRREYRKIAKGIQEWIGIAGSEAGNACIDSMLSKYPRRPSMIEELLKIRGR